MQHDPKRTHTHRTQRTDEVTVPVVEEHVEVAKNARDVERVRVGKHVETRTVEVDASSMHEDVDVVRVPVGREVERAPEIRVEGDTTIIPVVEEVVVVERTLVLKEEIRVTKRRTTQPKRLRVPLRSEQVDIERELSKEELERRGAS